MSRPTVLCAMDNRDLSGIFEKALRGSDYGTEVVHQGDQVAAAAHNTQPDLLIMDVSLARRDGFTVLEEMRRSDFPASRIPVILLSAGRVSPHYQKRADELGADLLLAKPVPLDQLLDEVSRLAKNGPPAAVGSQRSVHPSPPEKKSKVDPETGGSPDVALAGTLAELPFPRLLHQLHGLRASGVLMLSAGRRRKALQLRDGYPIAIKSNFAQECLGNHLIRQGVLDEKEHRESLRRMKRGEGLQGEVLVAMEVLDEEQIANALRDQAHEKLFEIFEWTSGSFELQRAEQLRRANVLSLDTSPGNVILQGVRERYPISAIESFLASRSGCFVARAESPFYRFQDVELSDPEQELMRRIEKRQSLATIAGQSETARRALFGLIATGFLELASQKGKDEVEHGFLTFEREAAGPPRDDESLRVELAKLAERLRTQNYYEVLGVKEGGIDHEFLERNYEDLARRVHPDRFRKSGSGIRQLASEIYDLITQARECLGDPRQRQIYSLELRKGQRIVAEQEEGKRVFDAESEFQKGLNHFRARSYEDALAFFGKALQQNPSDGEYHAHYGWCLHLCHQDDAAMVGEAIEHVRRGAKLAREREKPYLFLGRLYKVAGQVEAAEKMFARAVQIKPECVEALRELRLISMRREKQKGLIGRLLRR